MEKNRILGTYGGTLNKSKPRWNDAKEVIHKAIVAIFPILPDARFSPASDLQTRVMPLQFFARSCIGHHPCYNTEDKT